MSIESERLPSVSVPLLHKPLCVAAVYADAFGLWIQGMLMPVKHKQLMVVLKNFRLHRFFAYKFSVFSLTIH